MQINPRARAIIDTLRSRGHQALLAGGCVRDMLLDREPHDWDIATSAAPAQIAEIFPRSLAVGAAFGVMTVVAGAGENREQFEVATFRRDGEYRDGRHPDRVEFSSPRADATRRDFTINALFYDPSAAEIIDYVGGQNDLAKKIIRAVGEPEKRFQEDRLRLLRAVRFAARLDFAIEENTAAAIKKTPLTGISAERVAAELNQIFTGDGAGRGLQMLADFGLLAATLPEVEALRGVEQPPEFHPEGDVFAHTKLMLDRFSATPPDEALLALTKDERRMLAWAVVLHDVGKPATQTFDGRWRFNRHDEAGATLAAEILHRLKMPARMSAAVRDLVARHMHFVDLRKWREAKRRRFLQDPLFPAHLALHYLDCAGSHGMLAGYEYAAAALSAERARPPSPPPLLTGADLIALGYPPGALFKEILTAAQDAALEGELTSKEEARAWVRAKWKNKVEF
ncbi:MAG: CCA tRNA nucleotidyltransferase [Planctomycetota bacterium]|jgi:poly(A) polymerase|nr:CCA tRNA nucleotidyltransferase [Planctomycetota bacterium]